DKQKKGFDLRILLADGPEARPMLEAMQASGFDMKHVKVQPAMNNAGMIIDGQIVVIGSHSWTNDAVVQDRNASLAIFDEGVAGYYAEVFRYDWEHLGRQRLDSETEFDGMLGMPRIEGSGPREKGWMQVPESSVAF